MSETRTVWVTKYAMTMGIVECDVNEHWTKIASDCNGRHIYVDWDCGLNGVMGVYAHEYGDTIEAAQAQVKEAVAKKLASLDKQRAKMEKFARDGVNVVRRGS